MPSAWLLLQAQNSSGGKERLGSISKAGHRYLRQMLVVGSMAVIRHVSGSAGAAHGWRSSLARKRARLRQSRSPTRSPGPSGR